jgi:hypothetical protein
MRSGNRREFLLGAGGVVANAVAGPRLLADIFKAAPDAIAPDNKPRQPMRGLMIDAGRLSESMQYYRRVVDFCAEWELNTLQFRLADDQGCTLRFASVAHLVTHENAFAPEQLRALAEYAQSHGVDLIPELESFGHTGYITRSPAYAHLLDSDPHGSTEFTGITPVNAESLHLFEKLYREIAAIFPSSYLHGGCDEVNWGGSALSRQALETKSRAQIWAEYLGSLNTIAERLGKQWIVWADFILHKEPEILPRLNKKIILMDWDYLETDSAVIRESLNKIRANGSRGIGAPALTCYRWGPRVGADQLRNIDAFADAYLGESDPGSLGVILTNWIPSRYLQNSIWDGFAYAAVAFKQGTAAARSSGFRGFVEKHFSAKWNGVWSEAFQLIYDAAPYASDDGAARGKELPLPIPWSSDEQLAAVLKEGTQRPNPFTRLRALLVELELLVRKNLCDFQAFALSAEYLERLFWRDSAVIELAAGKPLKPENADLLMQSIAERDRALAEALSKDWDQGRFPDSIAKRKAVFGLWPKDQLLFQWQRAAAYSADLASHPQRFRQLLHAALSKLGPA